MWLRALKSWVNNDYEGRVVPEQVFEATEYRARDLIRLGLALAVVRNDEKIKVPSDPPRARPSPRRRAP